MIYPQTILSLKNIPSYFDKDLELRKPKYLNIFVDLKNISKALFIDEVVQEIVNDDEKLNSRSSIIFQAVMNFSIFWKELANSKGLKLRIIYATDKGESAYHFGIHSKYKEARRVGAVDLPAYYDTLTELRRVNSSLAEKVLNLIPDCYFFYLNFLESDFLPYYLIRNYFTDPDDYNVILSSDHDMYQMLKEDNICQMYCIKGITKLIKKPTALMAYLKYKTLSEKTKLKIDPIIRDFDINHMASLMAIIGCAGDGVPGIKGIGPISAVKMFSDIKLVEKYIGKPEEIPKRLILDGGNFFDNSRDGNIPGDGLWQKVVIDNKIATNAYKLISFECLSLWVDHNLSTNGVKNKEYIERILNKENINVLDKPIPIIKQLNLLEDLAFNPDNINILFE